MEHDSLSSKGGKCWLPWKIVIHNCHCLVMCRIDAELIWGQKFNLGFKTEDVRDVRGMAPKRADMVAIVQQVSKQDKFGWKMQSEQL